MTFTLPTGHLVRVARAEHSTEFATYNASGDCISTVYLTGAEAHTMHMNLRKVAK